ncbi:MAG: hypothetical protein HUK21_03635 [Fibrobacteraceae bacterium]|nr:hypothetical protein [Fibrobacteraceae bacterium]
MGTKLLKFFGYSALVCLLLGCTTVESDEEQYLLPDSLLRFGLYPNDPAPNDSASANLSHGVVLFVHPNAHYELSFDKDEAAPVPKLQLFRLYETSGGTSAANVRSLKPEEQNGRYLFRFTCEENKNALWATSLVYDNDYYTGSTRNVKFVADGAYSSHFSINLVVTGKLGKKSNENWVTSDSVNIKEFSRILLENFRHHYSYDKNNKPSGIVIDTLYISYAHENPLVGKLFPETDPWLAQYDDLFFVDTLSNWPDAKVRNALDIVLIHRIEYDGMMGVSNLFSGNMGSGFGSSVVVGAYVKNGNGEEALSSEDIVETAIHETGHFFGLRHTTATIDDIVSTKDLSNWEDGFEDTPYCSALVKAKNKVPAKRSGRQGSDFFFMPKRLKQTILASSGSGSDFMYEQCEDADNDMFPMASDVKVEGFTEMQLDLVKKSLMIYPH